MPRPFVTPEGWRERRRCLAQRGSSRATCATYHCLRLGSTRRFSCTSSSKPSPARNSRKCSRASRRRSPRRGTLIVEMRLHPDQPPGRIDWWDVVPNSLLSDKRHLLLGDAVYDERRHTYVLREVAVFDDGSVAARQTSGWLCPFASIPRPLRASGTRRCVDVRRVDQRAGARAVGIHPRGRSAPVALTPSTGGASRYHSLPRSGSPVWS